MDQYESTCNQLATTLGGKGMMEGSVCMVSVDRKDIQATIANQPFHSISRMFHFEKPDASGNALITGEMVPLENEVHKIVSALSREGLIVSALHSHWLFDNPKLMYIHLEALMNPLTFANIIAKNKP